MFSTFNIFLISCIVLALLASLIVILPWWHSKSNAVRPLDNQLIDLNIDVYHSRLRELIIDRDNGLINERQYQSQKVELERQLLKAKQSSLPMHTPDIKYRLLLIVVVPVISAFIYLFISDRSSVYALWQAQNSVGQVADDMLTGKITAPPEWAVEDGGEALISAMQTNVHHHADDPQRWLTLYELFLFLQVPDAALDALTRAYRLSPDNLDIAIPYAQMSFSANEEKLDDNTRRVLEDILKQHPDDESAQILMARGEASIGNYEQAQYWVTKLRDNIKNQPGDHVHLLTSVEALAADIADQQHQSTKDIKIHVTINDNLFAKIKADGVLFVTIRDTNGGPPYAAKRIPISTLKRGEITVSLGDGDAMMPERTINAAKASGQTLVVSARISHSGNALAESGDLTSKAMVLTKDQQQINIEIDRQIP